MQRVLINGLQIGDTNTGVQYYAKNLFSTLRNIQDDSCVVNLLKKSDLGLESSFLNRVRRVLHENFLFQTYLNKNSFDLYHSPNYVLPFYIKTPSILTIHDLITLDYPEFCQMESVLYFKLLLSSSVKKAVKVIAVSNKVKEDILRHFNVPEEKIEVVYLGIDNNFQKVADKLILEQVREKYQLPRDYILFVGNIEPKKNLERLIEAFVLVRKRSCLKHKLVITGKKGWKYKSVFKAISRLDIGHEILLTGYVPEQDLPAIYSMSSLFVFPSLYEGFGIPPLEAMACEVPVIVSDKGALPEVTGGNCFQADSYNIKDIAEKMEVLLTDERLIKNHVTKGKKWVKQFTWERTAEKTKRIYEKAME